jgi:hypothetical protein
MRSTPHGMRRRSCWLLLGGLVLAACAEGRDETQVRPPSGGGTGGVSGASGAGGAASNGGAGNGGSGDGGTGGEIRDAGGAGTGGAPGNQCQSLDVYCSGDSHAFIAVCPDLANNRQALRQTRLNQIVERRCVSESGAPRIAVHASMGPQYVTTLVYDPATGQLVGADFRDDIDYGCFGDLSHDCGFYGEPLFAGCDGGAEGLNASDAAPYECIVPEPDASVP